MNRETAERITAELERFELFYGDKKLLRKSKLREVLLDLRRRTRRSLTLLLPLCLVIDLPLFLGDSSFEMSSTAWVGLSIRLVVAVTYIGFSVWTLHRTLKLSYWLRELVDRTGRAALAVAAASSLAIRGVGVRGI